MQRYSSEMTTYCLSPFMASCVLEFREIRHWRRDTASNAELSAAAAAVVVVVAGILRAACGSLSRSARFRRVHVVSEFVRRQPQLLFKAEVGCRFGLGTRHVGSSDRINAPERPGERISWFSYESPRELSDERDTSCPTPAKSFSWLALFFSSRRVRPRARTSGRVGRWRRG